MSTSLVGLHHRTSARADPRDPRTIGLDWPGAITATAGITAFVLAVIQGPERDWTDPLIDLLIGAIEQPARRPRLRWTAR